MRLNRLISMLLAAAMLLSPIASLAEFMPFNPVPTATPAPVCKHSWTVVSRNEPTCDEYGDETLQCKKCGDWGDRSVDPLGHSWKWTTAQAATCQHNDGYCIIYAGVTVNYNRNFSHLFLQKIHI